MLLAVAALRRATVKLKDELRKTSPPPAAVEPAALQVLNQAREITARLRQDKNLSFSFDKADAEYHEAVAEVLIKLGQGAGSTVPEKALDAILEAYSILATVCSVVMFQQLVDARQMLSGLVTVIQKGSSVAVVHAVFLLSQLALVSPKTSLTISLLPGLTEGCCKSFTAGRKAGKTSESLALNTALMVNNLSALGGEEAIQALTANGELVRELGAWLENASDAETLQRLTGVFNHLSRSTQSARALHAHGIVQALERLTSRKVGGSPQSREAYLGLANMAMANIVVRQVKPTGASLHLTQTPAIKSVVKFLRLAIEGRHLSGIYFRVYDVLFALDSLSKYSERDLLGIECGLVDLAVQVTAEWSPGKYSSIFSDAKASTHPVLELSTDILMHLAHSEACKKRMHALNLEAVLERLLRTEEGIVRDHVLKVLYVLRDKKEVKECALKIIEAVNRLQQVSAKYGVSSMSSESKHKQMAVWLTAKMRDNSVEVRSHNPSSREQLSFILSPSTLQP